MVKKTTLLLLNQCENVQGSIGRASDHLPSVMSTTFLFSILPICYSDISFSIIQLSADSIPKVPVKGCYGCLCFVNKRPSLCSLDSHDHRKDRTIMH